MLIRSKTAAILLAMGSIALADGLKKPERTIPWAGYNQGIRWESSFEVAMKKARESRKPLLLHQLVGNMKAEGC